MKGTLEFSGNRQSLSLPYVNAQDSRMVPNTFEAYLLWNRMSAPDDDKIRGK